MIPADRFYVDGLGPPRQGDILLAGVSRLVADDRFSPPAWDRLDAHDVTVHGAREGNDMWLETGAALVMVTSHDCHFDKEWNQRVRMLIREGVEEREAHRIAEADQTLDRTFNASPLVYPHEVNRDRGNLMAGRVLGFLPVPASHDGVVPEAVVDLTYRVTLDRLDVVPLKAVGTEARMQLRYALAQLDTLRATSVGFELERVVGRHIERVTFPRERPLFVRLHLDDGTEIDLLQPPVEPNEDAPGRTIPPGSAA